MNKKLWDLFKNSSEGKEAIKLFTFDLENENDVEDRITIIYKKYKDYLLDDFEAKSWYVFINIYYKKLNIKKRENSSKYFTRLIDNLELSYINLNNNREFISFLKDVPQFISKQNYKSICAILPEISLILYIYEDLFFFPLLFNEKFDIFMKILDVLDIPMPSLPAKTDKRGRLLLYNEINENINKFALENNLSKAETCTCIYEFSLLLLDANDDMDTELPEPTNIWLTGGDKEDYKIWVFVI